MVPACHKLCDGDKALLHVLERLWLVPTSLRSTGGSHSRAFPSQPCGCGVETPSGQILHPGMPLGWALRGAQGFPCKTDG